MVKKVIYDTPETLGKMIPNQQKVLKAMAKFNWNCRVDYKNDIPMFILTITPNKTNEGVELRIKMPLLKKR